MKYDLTDDNIHKGHRQRMRSKLIAHGKTIFDTYELLEMLLYYTIPYKDTNPIAKRLLVTFGGLDGVLSASAEQLGECEGIGEKTARFLCEVGELSDILGAELVLDDRSIFVGHNDAGGFFVDYFKNVKERKVVAAFLDNKLELISLEEIAVGCDYDSAAIKAKPFIDGAIKHKASAVITAHNHPFGSPYPTQGDRATNVMVRNALDLIKVTLAEHFVVSGDRYVGIMQELSINYSQSPYLDEFIKGRGDGESSYGISEETLLRLNNNYNVDDSKYFAGLLSYSGRLDKTEEALRLLRRFRTIEAILDASLDELSKYVSDAGALFIKLLAYVTSRRITDKYQMDKNYSKKEIAEYLKGLYVGETEEEIYLLCFDSKDRLVASELVGVGTVNTSEVLPRKLLERAIRCSAKKVIVAHNHPGGRADPSAQDISAVTEMLDLFRCSGIELVADCVVAGQKCLMLDCFGIKTTVL